MTLTVGSLCTGTGTFELALARVLDVELLWVSDPDPGAATLLQYRYPDVPNLGDLTQVDWRAIRRPDIVTAGFPCQDISAAGKQAGLRAGTRSGLWFNIATALDVLQPKLVLIENVEAILSADADSDVEPCTWCLGDRPAGHLRALGAVLGDLADRGFDAEWAMLAASGVGAPHRRRRVFVAAAAADPGRWGVQRWADGRGVSGPEVAGVGEGLQRQRGRYAAGDAGPVVADPEGNGWGAWAGGREPGDPAGFGRDRVDTGRGGEPVADPDGAGSQGQGGAEPEAARGRYPEGGCGAELRPAEHRGPPVADSSGDGWHERGPEPAGQLGGPDVAVGGGEVVADPDGDGREIVQRVEPGMDARGDLDGRGPVDWDIYGPAVARWERLLGRAAPDPTVLGAQGSPQLNPRLSEWMQGLPEGWVTAVPGLSRNQMLRLLGNGPVWQQATAAIRELLTRLFDADVSVGEPDAVEAS